MAKLDVNKMTPAEIREHNLALWRQMTGQPPVERTAAEIRGDKAMHERVVVVFLKGTDVPPVEVPAASSVAIDDTAATEQQKEA